MLLEALHSVLPNPLYDSVKVLKKGGAVKQQDESVKQIVNVTIGDMKKMQRKPQKKKRKAKKKMEGDMVMLQKGQPPMAMGHSSIMGAYRLQTPGSVFGGGLPNVLQPDAYAMAPRTVLPMSRMDFTPGSDELFNRNRTKTDDVVIPTNPSEIKPVTRPSIRLTRTRNPNEIISQPQGNPLKNTSFQGDTPRLPIQMKPSERVIDSQPSSGFLMTQQPRKVVVSWSEGTQTSEEPQSLSSKEASQPQLDYTHYRAEAVKHPIVQAKLKKTHPGSPYIMENKKSRGGY